MAETKVPRHRRRTRPPRSPETRRIVGGQPVADPSAPAATTGASTPRDADKTPAKGGGKRRGGGSA